MSDRVILHCDLNNFFASVECFLNPELKGKNVAVCGSVEERHGIVLAKNEGAKKLGVKTGEAIWEAKIKCPDLVTVPPHYDQYVIFSKKVKAIYEEYTDMVEPFGIDECWLDITGSRQLFGDEMKIAEELRTRVKKETGLTISVGVSFNKIFAKLASDIKKPDAVTRLTRSDMKTKIWCLPCNDLLGVGRSTSKAFEKIGIKTIGDLAQMPRDTMKKLFGKPGLTLYDYANGLDFSPVLKESEAPPVKSVSRGITCKRDLYSAEEISPIVFSLSEKVAHNLRKNNFFATTVRVALKDNHLVVREFQQKLRTPVRAADVLAKNAMELIRKNYFFNLPVRAVTVFAGNLVENNFSCQMCLDEDYNYLEKIEKLDTSVDLLRERFGDKIIVRASSMPLTESERIRSAFPSFHPEL
ncbi:MAG: DNA polymerase IV [Clostridia bacterium]|nr:DNA polymerase IV [Clostridia bacterium]